MSEVGESLTSTPQVDFSLPLYAGDLFSSSTTIFTSGTTGKPKSLTYYQDQVTITIRQVLENFKEIGEFFDSSYLCIDFVIRSLDFNT